VLSQAIRELGIHINILHGRIEYIDGKPLGVLVVALLGTDAALTRTIVFLRDRVARLEVLRHG
jgi:D-methionine transport system ATP-binding protein